MKKRFLILFALILCTCLALFATSCTKIPRPPKPETSIESTTESKPLPNGVKVEFNTLTSNGTEVYGKVSNSTTEFDFKEEISISRANFVVSSDPYGKDTFFAKKIPLELGDNFVYLFITIDDEIIFTYNVTIRRRPTYDVTFSANGGTAVEIQVVEEDSLATEPQAPTKVGYTFTGWDYDFNKSITENTKITASWSANKDTKYTVNYYLQNLDDNEYTLHETVELKGETDTTATADIKEYTHFTYNASKSVISGNINGDGSRVLSVYYTRNKYVISTARNNAKAGTVAGVGSYKFDKEITLTATTNAGYTFLGWYDGETLVCETEEFNFKAEKNVTYTATWSANTDTKYTVIYYWQNIEDANYTLHETVELKGETDTTATADIKEYTHFTYNASKSVISGNINGDGSRILSVYYTRDTYSIVVNANNAKAGTSTQINGMYKYDKEFTLTATTNAGYTFLGWYDGETLVCETEEFTFKAEKNVTCTATWSANTDTKYTVIYYWQNIEDDNYTLHETVELKGETDTTATAQIKTFDHFAFNESASTLSGIISGDGNLVLKVYYTRINYEIKTMTNNSQAGEITGSGTYCYGKQITLSATTYLGYTFVGWYDGETLASKDAQFTFVADKHVGLVAIFEVKPEMENFNFTSTTTTCTITGIKDRTVTEVVIPDCVTSIGEDAFKECSKLTSVVISDSVTSIGYGAFVYCSSLTSVEIGDSVTLIGDSAFYNCSSLTSVVIPDSVTSIGDYAFFYCTSLTSVVIGDSVTYIGDAAFWYCSSLTSITIPDSVTSIGDDTFAYCISLTSVTIPDSVTSIGAAAFHNCSSLTSVVIGDSVISIGKSAFENCSSLTSVVIGDSVTSIGYRAFYDCSNLTSITIPDSVTSIGYEAFYGCRSLTSVVIGDSVTSIGHYAFAYCSSLTSIKYRGTQAQWNAISKGYGWNHYTGSYTITYNYNN